jgi:hypothetical protein
MKKLFIIAVAALFTIGLNAQAKDQAANVDPAAAKKAAKQAEKAAKKATGKTKESITVAPISKDPSIYLESDVVDYGIITKGADGVRTFKVTNKGAQPLLLTNCSGSCGCTVPTCPREPILPGKSAEVSVKYDTQRVGPISKQVNITSNDPANPNKVVMVKGEIKDAPAAP